MNKDLAFKSYGMYSDLEHQFSTTLWNKELSPYYCAGIGEASVHQEDGKQPQFSITSVELMELTGQPTLFEVSHLQNPNSRGKDDVDLCQHKSQELVFENDRVKIWKCTWGCNRLIEERYDDVDKEDIEDDSYFPVESSLAVLLEHISGKDDEDFEGSIDAFIDLMEAGEIYAI